MKSLAAGLLLGLCLVGTADAACRIQGARCLEARKIEPNPLHKVGAVLPRGEYQVLLNTALLGLPPSDGSFWYYRVERRILRVDPQTMKVLGDATREANKRRW